MGDHGFTQIDLNDLIAYYHSFTGSREANYKNSLGEDLNWSLSFEQYKEAETTKHVHRLHPYKGKFIPQLVEYFLDSHTDKFKKHVFFQKGDIVLDPFSGSGTTMVQACELGIHAIGIDVSAFNTMIANCKVTRYDFQDIQKELTRITMHLEKMIVSSQIAKFEDQLLAELNAFNNKYFPVPDYKYRLRKDEINEKEYGKQKENEFFPIYHSLLTRYQINLPSQTAENFIEKWFMPQAQGEINLVFSCIKEIKNPATKKIIALILSRTIRSCRATTHADLATLLEPITTTYYCSKHGKVCKPLFSILKWWNTYTKDTINRLKQFDRLRTNTFQHCLTGDSRKINIFEEIKKKMSTGSSALHNAQTLDFGSLLEKQKIKGIFSSPPYVGLIDYHEQHAYSYDLFGFERNDHLEIGPLFKGQTKEAQKNYIQGISDVLINCKKYLIEDYDIFLVANDKYNMYPIIAENAGMLILSQYKRPVLNRTEKDKRAYSETIFHLKGK